MSLGPNLTRDISVESITLPPSNTIDAHTASHAEFREPVMQNHDTIEGKIKMSSSEPATDNEIESKGTNQSSWKAMCLGKGDAAKQV